MMAGSKSSSRGRGSSLIEAVIALGVLAVAIPLVFGAIAGSGKSGMSAEAETRSTWIVPACMDEIQASRAGNPRFLTATVTGETFPRSGDVWALAFSPQGKILGKVDKGLYDKGIRELDGKAVRFVASLTADAGHGTPDDSADRELLSVTISLEYPSAAPAERREKIDFHTLIP